MTDIEELSRHLYFDPEFAVLRWRINGRGQTKRAGAIAGRLRHDGYYGIKVNQREFMVHRIIWAFHHGRWPLEQIDHINGARTDNNLSNLRECSAAQNLMNKGNFPKRRKNSKYKGVYPDHIGKNRWCARICVNRKQIRLGVFDTQEEAAIARIEGEKKYFGEFARSP